MTPTHARCFAVCVLLVGTALGCNGPTAPQPHEPDRTAETAQPEPAVTLTPGAAEAVSRHIAELRQNEPLYLRVRAVPGGCQGFQHKLDLDSVVTADDANWESRGVRVVALKRQVEMLRGSRVDYIDSEKEKGFTVENPNFKGAESKKWIDALARDGGGAN